MVSLQVEETSKFLMHCLKGVTKARVHSFLFSAILVRLFSSSSKMAATISAQRHKRDYPFLWFSVGAKSIFPGICTSHPHLETSLTSHGPESCRTPISKPIPDLD